MSLIIVATFAAFFGLVTFSVEATQSDPRFFLQRGSTGQGKATTPSSLVTSVPVLAKNYEEKLLAMPLGFRPKGKDLFIPRSNWFFPSFDSQENDEEENSGTAEFGDLENENEIANYKFGNYKRVGNNVANGWMPSFNPTGSRSNNPNPNSESRQATKNRIHRLNYNFFKLMG